MNQLVTSTLEVPNEVANDLNQLISVPLAQLIERDKLELPHTLKQWTKHLQTLLANERPALWLRLSAHVQSSWSLEQFRSFTVILGHSLGDLIVQNTEGHKLVTVFDRDPKRTMADGARYHQTHEGGSIHTDNVNIPEPWEYLILSCLAPAPVGGENILVDGDAVVAKMAKEFPAALKVLEANFWWEKRGVSDELYQAPIITYDKNGHACFRHLRPYMESAHRRANSPMTPEQIQAVDIMDAYLNSSELQSRFTMRAYDCLLSLDSRTLHGRTCFADNPNSVDINAWETTPSAPKRRTMERLWARRKIL